MNGEQTAPPSGLRPEYHNYDKQRCFVGHSVDAPWRDDLVMTCDEVLPTFGLEPWYAADHFTTKSLREKVVELIANTRYGIYDLSYWRKDDKSEWQMPRNVFIELGIAIALNRPMLLLRHKSNPTACLPLPQCLESISTHILAFSGAKTLRDVLKKQLTEWANTPPDQDWWNRYCTFGNRICKYREAHPHIWQLGEETVRCHISDGQDTDRPDFREVIEEVLGRFNDVSFDYLDALSPCKGYDFLLCTHCQTVRSTPFAIYRITEQTPPETFIAIGISLALETQFTHTIPKILLTSHIAHIPSLLTGYEVVVAHNDHERKTYLRKFMPQVIQLARKTTWKPRPLPFIEIVPQPVEKPSDENEQEAEEERSEDLLSQLTTLPPYDDIPTIVMAERSPFQDLLEPTPNGNAVEKPKASSPSRLLKNTNYIGQTISTYRIESEIDRGGLAHVYLAQHLDAASRVAIKIFYAHLSEQQQRNLSLLETLLRDSLRHPHILPVFEVSLQQQPQYIICEYATGGTLHDRILLRQPRLLPLEEAITILSQVGEALAFIHQQGIVHRDLKPANILFNELGEVRLADFDLAIKLDADDETKKVDTAGSPPYMAPEQFEGSVSRYSDQYVLGCIAYELCTGSRPFNADNFTALHFKHASEQVLAPRLLNPDLPVHIERAILRALAKKPDERFSDVMAFVEELWGS